MHLKIWREGQGLSQRALAREWGCSHVWIQQLESPRANPTRATMDDVEIKTAGAVTRIDWPKEEER